MSRPLLFGRIIHSMLENRANKKDPELALEEAKKEYGKLMREERELYGDIIEDARDIFEAYEEYWKNDKIKYLKIKGISAEHELEMDLGDGILLVAKIDQIGSTSNGLQWLIEDKTFKKRPSDGFRLRDTQTALYAAMVNKCGIADLDGVMWNYVTNQPLAKPELLKNGELSRNQNTRTTPRLFKRAIREYGLKVADYEDFLETLEKRQRDLFTRIYMPIKEELCDTLIEEALITSKEMREKGETDSTRNLTRDCDWCEFEPLCRAQLMGHDDKFIIRREYAKRQSPKEAEQGDEE